MGLGLPARDILKLYVEEGPAIFDQQHGAIENWVRQKLRGVAHLLVTKHSSEPLRRALEGVLGHRTLGESRTRLVIPAWHPMLERVYIYKTAHHPRLETDYNLPAMDAALATAAAPTFLKPHMTDDAVELVDGGVWANNPIGVAAIEAIGVLDWPGDKLKILSIGTINEPGRVADEQQAPNGLVGDALLHGRPIAQRVRHRQNSSPATATSAGDLAHPPNGAGRPLHLGQRRTHFGDEDRGFAEAREQLPEAQAAIPFVVASEFVPFHKQWGPPGAGRASNWLLGNPENRYNSRRVTVQLMETNHDHVPRSCRPSHARRDARNG